MRTVRLVTLTLPVLVSGILPPLLEPDLWFPMDIVKDGLLKGREYDGTLSGPPDIVTGVFGNGIGFNRLAGVNQYVNYGNLRSTCFGDPDLCPGGFTFSIWIKLFTPRSSLVYFVGSGGHTKRSYGVSLYNSNGQLSFAVRILSGEWWLLSVPVSTVSFETWIHLVAVWHPHSLAKFYVNGQFKSSSSALKLQASTVYNDFVLGAPNNGLSVTTMFGSCILDDLRFWYRTLSYTEILELSQEGQANLASSIYSVTDGLNSYLTDNNKSTCLSLQTVGPSVRSSLVDVSLPDVSLPNLESISVRLMGGYRQDYVEVFIGQSSLGCLSLYSCEYYTSAWEGPLLYTYHNCSCPSDVCTHLFLGISAAGKQCDIDWSYCQPIVLCQLEIL